MITSSLAIHSTQAASAVNVF